MWATGGLGGGLRGLSIILSIIFIVIKKETVDYVTVSFLLGLHFSGGKTHVQASLNAKPPLCSMVRHCCLHCFFWFCFFCCFYVMFITSFLGRSGDEAGCLR